MKRAGKAGSFVGSLERLVDEVRRGTVLVLKNGLVVGSLLLPVAGIEACAADDGNTGAPGDEGDLPQYLGKADWAQDEGKRNTDMVAYDQGWWHEMRDCSNRGGCMSVDVFLKLKVQPVEGANIDTKRVGVVVKSPDGSSEAKTYVGSYFSTADGKEEWHVRVSRRGWESGPFVFTAWYQDGKGNTWFDDNEGEFHAVSYQGNYAVIRQAWDQTTVKVDGDGVNGKISLYVADLDFDKVVDMVWSIDDWKTSNVAHMGDPNEPNSTHWVENLWAGTQRWEINLAIPGEDVQAFQYAFLYKHGVVGAAKTYEFWDNNYGNNYVIRRAAE